MTLKGGFTATDPRLDRLPSFDERSRNYPVRALLDAMPKPSPRSHTWPNYWITDQQGGRCVAHSHKGKIANPPVSPDRTLTDASLTQAAQDVFVEYQRADEWPGELPDYDGTSVIAGAQVETAKGNYKSYWWAFNIDDALLGIEYVCPAIFGIEWLDSMFEPRPSGLLDCSGNPAGGHAIRGRGVLLRARLKGEGTKRRELVRLPNSWSRSWGVDGECFITVPDLEARLKAGGECLFGIEPGQKRVSL